MEAWTRGYLPTSNVVGPLTGDQAQDFALEADPVACTALGYEEVYAYMEDFETSDGGYTHSGAIDEWAWGTPTAWPNSCASGSQCWGIDLNGYMDPVVF